MIRVKEALRSQAGNVLAGTLIGSMVSLVLIGAIAAGIILLITMQAKVGLSNSLTGQITAVDAALRADIRFASTITPTNDRAVSFTDPGEAGRCRTAEWSVQAAEGATQLVRVVTQYPEYDATVNPVRCGGKPASPEVTVMAGSIAPATRFEYANAGGRGLTATAGSLVPADGATRPASVPASRWNSSTLASVSLTSAFGYGTETPQAVRIHQGAPSLSSVIGPVDMPSHEVSDKSLRAG